MTFNTDKEYYDYLIGHGYTESRARQTTEDRRAMIDLYAKRKEKSEPRIITSSTYERADKRMQARVLRNMGR